MERPLWSVPSPRGSALARAAGEETGPCRHILGTLASLGRWYQNEERRTRECRRGRAKVLSIITRYWKKKNRKKNPLDSEPSGPLFASPAIHA